MRTRSQSRNNLPQQEASPVIVEPLRIEPPFLEDQFQEGHPPKVLMANNRTMAELLQPPSVTRTACPHHGFSELYQLDIFYNALNVNDQDSLNSVAGLNFLDKMPRECLKIIQSKSKVRQSRAKFFVAKVDKKNQSSALTLSPTPAPVKAVEPNCVTCGGTHSYQNCPATSENVYRDNIQEMDECLALADLGESINLMPLSMWEALLLSELTLTCMTLELADRSVSKPIGIAKDVSFKVGVFRFPADFVGEVTLCIGNKAITYNLDQTVRYSANYNQITANKIDVIEMACKEYSQEVLGFSDVTASGNPTPHDDLIISTTSPTLTLFRDSDFLLFEEADAFLGLEDDLNSPKINPFYYDLKGDILLLEAILNSEPLPPLPNHEQYCLRSRKN
uniref:Reverse transcriptase domain-containing protein n=1 Tax=Tanacetum cinerariifolium TaxID=118510 RepID=A0A6L2MQN7_TANCI|nr:reverse transcriptase domain-containing protein [Tanacetum cinerariifolium]